MKENQDESALPERLVSLDVYRGIVMFLLIGEGAAIYIALAELNLPWLNAIAEQFEHPPWRGLRFWDLIQPGFMFIVGVAMVFSLTKRATRGDTWSKTFRHILWRCLALLLLGIGLHCVYNGRLVWELWNVLTQLSVTIMITFLIFHLPMWVQFAISLLLIGVTDLAYRLVHIPPYDQTFVPGQNFGSWMDMMLMGKVSEGHWVAINAIPTTAHTIWGSLAGQLLIGPSAPARKTVLLIFFGVLGVLVGYGMDMVGIAPIVKRICTSSFVIVSGGWCLLALGILYWMIDVKKWKVGTVFFVVVGMNPIFIYLVKELLAYSWMNPTVNIFTSGVLSRTGVPEPYIAVVNALIVWGLLWGLCWWLYKKKIFIRI